MNNRRDKQEAKIIKLAKVRQAAIELRIAQKNYMADRGNEELGKAVGRSAELLDQAIADSYGPRCEPSGAV